MNFIKYLAGGVFLVSASFSFPSFAGVNSASVSITVKPATVNLSCTAGKEVWDCSVSFPVGLTSNSRVTVSWPNSTGYDSGTWDSYGSSFDIQAGSVSTGLVSGGVYNWKSRCDANVKDALCSINGLYVGSTTIGVHRCAGYGYTDFCGGNDGDVGNTCNGYVYGPVMTYTFTITY